MIKKVGYWTAHGTEIREEVDDDFIPDEVNTPTIEPTPEERIAALEVLTDDIVLFMADLIGG